MTSACPACAPAALLVVGQRAQPSQLSPDPCRELQQQQRDDGATH